MKKRFLALGICTALASSMMVGCGSKDTSTTAKTSTNASEEKASTENTSEKASTENTSEVASVENTSEAAASTGDTSEITYWSMWQSTEPQAEVIQEAADAYEAETGIHVNIEWKGRDIQTIILAAIEGGESIDLFDEDIQRACQNYSDVTLDLSDMAAAGNYEDSAMPVLVNSVKEWCNGELKAIGYQPYTSGIFYDKAAFTKAGIEKEPTTWAEFLDVCQKLKDAGYTPLALDDAYVRLNVGYHLARELGQDGLKAVVTDGTWATEAKVLEGLTQLEDLVKNGFVSAPAVYPKGENNIGFGTAAMVVNASWVPNEIQNNTETELEWGCFSYPAVENGVDGTDAAMIGAQAFAINKDSKNAQAAYDFIMKITTGEFDKKMADATNSIPSDKNNEEWPALLQGCKESFVNLTKAYEWDCGIDANDSMKEIINENAMKLFEGSLTAQEFVDNMAGQY